MRPWAVWPIEGILLRDGSRAGGTAPILWIRDKWEQASSKLKKGGEWDLKGRRVSKEEETRRQSRSWVTWPCRLKETPLSPLLLCFSLQYFQACSLHVLLIIKESSELLCVPQ